MVDAVFLAYNEPPSISPPLSLHPTKWLRNEEAEKLARPLRIVYRYPYTNQYDAKLFIILWKRQFRFQMVAYDRIHRASSSCFVCFLFVIQVA